MAIVWSAIPSDIPTANALMTACWLVELAIRATKRAKSTLTAVHLPEFLAEPLGPVYAGIIIKVTKNSDLKYGVEVSVVP